MLVNGEVLNSIRSRERSAVSVVKVSALSLGTVTRFNKVDLTSCEVSESRSCVGSKPSNVLNRGGHVSCVDAAETSGPTRVEHQASHYVLFQMLQFPIAGYVPLREIVRSVQ